ncbi:cytochrome c-type biogenesis protein [Woodsholea maritima]|uniref:cytochrome c-type biogenesis protein n=1 Tax=Woodsholea maritima TaxID=240237 RepID=UPI000381BD37|nr:cytochrome c-type biogenesis protein [Woodsholea maritima]
MIALILVLALQSVSPTLSEAEEAHAQDVMRDIRCVVCSGESILDSQAGVARDMRTFIRERVSEGYTSEAIKDALVTRYGDEVLMRPPVNGRTSLLWLAPLIFLGLGGGLLYGASRAKKSA